MERPRGMKLARVNLLSLRLKSGLRVLALLQVRNADLITLSFTVTSKLSLSNAGSSLTLEHRRQTPTSSLSPRQAVSSQSASVRQFLATTRRLDVCLLCVPILSSSSIPKSMGNAEAAASEVLPFTTTVSSFADTHKETLATATCRIGRRSSNIRKLVVTICVVVFLLFLPNSSSISFSSSPKETSKIVKGEVEPNQLLNASVDIRGILSFNFRTKPNLHLPLPLSSPSTSLTFSNVSSCLDDFVSALKLCDSVQERFLNRLDEPKVSLVWTWTNGSDPRISDWRQYAKGEGAQLDYPEFELEDDGDSPDSEVMRHFRSVLSILDLQFEPYNRCNVLEITMSFDTPFVRCSRRYLSPKSTPSILSLAILPRFYLPSARRPSLSPL
jgi:hypothetical protein